MQRGYGPGRGASPSKPQGREARPSLGFPSRPASTQTSAVDTMLRSDYSAYMRPWQLLKSSVPRPCNLPGRRGRGTQDLEG